MKQVIPPALLIACALWLVVSSHAAAQAVRIAVAGDVSLANLVDVTTGELSNQPELSILDRADLDKLGQEQEIQSVLASKDFSPVRLLPADGLILLRSVAKDGKTGVFARLVAVQPGLILREFPLPDTNDPPAQAQALVKECAPYWSKLAAIQKGKITALSLLGLRFEVDAPEARDMERSINVLLASRLSAEPNTIVLERWRLNDALFEKTLLSQQPSPFWTGSSLIDGSMRWEKVTNRIDVTLRLRPSQGSVISISEQDTPENLAALVGRLADKIHGSSATGAAWNGMAEASHFASLGKWCLDNGLPEEGSEALESALALGDNSGTTKLLQAKAYGLVVFPDDLHALYPHVDSYRADAITPDSLPERVQAGRLATALMSDYLTNNRVVPAPPSDAEGPVDLGVRLLYNCVRLLRSCYENDYQVDHSGEVTELRHQIQKLILALDGPMQAQLTSPLKLSYMHYLVYYAGFWHETPEATCAFYRENLGVKWDGLGIHATLFNYDMSHAPYLDEGQGGELYRHTGQMNGPPWIVTWDGRSADEVRAVWQHFVNELEACPDPVLQSDGYKFEFSSSETAAARTAVLARFVVFLQQHADSLSGPRGRPFAVGFDPLFYWACSRADNANARQAIANLYISLLHQHLTLPPSWILNGSRLLYGGESVENARDILAALNDYCQWYRTQTHQSPKLLLTLGEMRQTIYRAKPELIPPPEQADFLAVNRFWLNNVKAIDGSIYPTAPYVFVDQATLTISENKIWFINHHQPYQICCVDPATLQIVSTLPIPDEDDSPEAGTHRDIHSLDVSPQLLAVGVADRLLIYSRAHNQWQALDVPPFVYKPRFVKQQLYLLYSPIPVPGTYDTKNVGSGLIRVSLPGGTIENVISSRRIPPQTALDGKPLGYPLDLWLTQGGLTLAVTAHDPPFQAYATPLAKNDWSLLTSAPEPCHLRLSSGGALIGAGMTRAGLEQLTFIDPSGSKLLLANPEFATKYGSGKPLWDFPTGLRTKSPADIMQISPIMRGEDLCLYANLQNGVADGKEASLYYFARGQKEGLRIPLAFDIDQLKGTHSRRLQTPILNYGSLQSTDYGLVIYGISDAGFWVIPWSDIDAYRARSIPAPASATPATASQSPDE
jgi:hypothetical protein